MSGAPAGRRDLPVADHAEQAATAHPEGAALFAGACATCHAEGSPMMAEGRPALNLGTPLHDNTPRDAIQILLRGLEPPTGRAGPAMPAYGDIFTDRQLVDIAAYLRARYTDQPPWPDLPRSVAQARKEGAE
jgi:mono/diheme cytochrome c family protein